MNGLGLSIGIEWLDAPDVVDVVDAALWARLEMTVTGMDGTHAVLTAATDRKTAQVRHGVYGSVFPLARWVADSYWSLLWEARRAPRIRSGRESARIGWLRPWVQRHCLLAAREGFSLPDVTIARDGEHVVVAAFPDPGVASVARRPVSFISSAFLRLERRSVESSLRDFMDSVLERVRHVEHPDVEGLRNDWSAVAGAEPAEVRLCSSAARLGIDPHDGDAMNDDLVSLIDKGLCGLPDELRADLLDAAYGGAEAAETLDWLVENLQDLRGLPAPGGVEVNAVAATAHETGYERARLIRERIKLDPRDTSANVVGAAGGALGFSFSNCRRPARPTPATVDSVVAADGSGAPLQVGPDLPHEGKAFRWARAVYLWQFGHLRGGPRLLSPAHDRLQREARAFAAEFLAPAAGLRRVIRRGYVGEEELTELARIFNVSPLLIRHQIENHQLAVLQ